MDSLPELQLVVYSKLSLAGGGEKPWQMAVAGVSTSVAWKALLHIFQDEIVTDKP